MLVSIRQKAGIRVTCDRLSKPVVLSLSGGVNMPSLRGRAAPVGTPTTAMEFPAAGCAAPARSRHHRSNGSRSQQLAAPSARKPIKSQADGGHAVRAEIAGRMNKAVGTQRSLATPPGARRSKGEERWPRPARFFSSTAAPPCESPRRDSERSAAWRPAQVKGRSTAWRCFFAALLLSRLLPGVRCVIRPQAGVAQCSMTQSVRQRDRPKSANIVPNNRNEICRCIEIENISLWLPPSIY